MKQIKSMKLRQFQTVLNSNGFILVRTGKHLVYRHSSGKTLTVPYQIGDVGKLYIRDMHKIINGVA